MSTNIEKFKKISALISLGSHVVLILFLVFSPESCGTKIEETPITYVSLSFGDGGTNLKANNQIKGLPSSTIRDQKEALKQLAKLKEIPKEKTDTPPPLNSKLSDKSLTPPVEKKTVKIGGGHTKVDTTQKKVVERDPLAEISERVKIRTQQAKQIEIGTGQSKEKESGQSLWGGQSGTAIDPALVAYYSLLKRKITNAWLISKGQYTGTLVAKVDVNIDNQGKVISVSFDRTSGDGSFDDAAMRAVKKVSPFPSPPDSIRGTILKEGFRFTFNPTSVSAGSVN